jgi:hypothetical protein
MGDWMRSSSPASITPSPLASMYDNQPLTTLPPVTEVVLEEQRAHQRHIDAATAPRDSLRA